ncbi:MAG: outer membrane beta-barrel protein [Pseudomonadota bacterium]
MRQNFIIVVAGAATAAIALAAPANAAEKCFNKATLTYEDCPAPPAPPPAPAPIAEAAPTPWTGPYAGLHAGYAWADAEFTDDFLDDVARVGATVDDDEFDIEGFLAGGQLGYLHQYRNNVVIGAEIDGSLVWADDSVGATIPTGQTVVTGDLEGELDYLASARLRLGYAIGNVLPYATGGIGFSGWDFNGEDVMAFGGVAGGGVEALVAENFVVGAEGLYYFFDKSDDLDGDLGYDVIEVDDVIVARIRASYKF